MADRDQTKPPHRSQPSGSRPSGTLTTGTAFGRYRIERLLGEGGMGAVYLAKDETLNRSVALKIPKFEPGDEDGRRRFLREAQTAGSLHHPNICPVFDAGEIDGVLFLTMAYVDGRPLSEWCDPGRLLSPRQAAVLVRKLAIALGKAHEAGVVHRDIKPANVMIDKAGEPIVMDFGLARSYGDSQQSRLTQTGTIMGSPAYMSPEQVQGKTNALGPATDIYSLGVVLYELLTGRVPFDGPIAVVMAKLLTKAAPPPRQFRPELDEGLEAVCLKMMAKKVCDRFVSMDDVAVALAAALKGQAAEGEATEAGKISQSPKKVGGTAAYQGPAQQTVSRKTRSQAIVSAADAEALYQTARQCFDRHDYVDAGRLLEEIPASLRTAAMSEMLQQTRQLQTQIEELNRQIDQALSVSDARGLKPAVRRLLELKPSDLRSRRLRDALKRPGGLERFIASGGAVAASDGLLTGMSGIVKAMIAVFSIAFLGTLGWTWHYLRNSGPPNPQIASNQRGSGDAADGPSELLGERYALLVGVRNYSENSGLADLKYTDADVESLADVLKASGFRSENVTLMTQKRGADDTRFLPTRENIRRELASLLRDRNPHDSVFVALAGHGVQFKGDDQSYFCPADAAVVDKDKAKGTLIPLGDVYKDLETSPAGFKLLFSDACRNDPYSSASRRASVDLESVTRPQKLPPPGGVAAFFSCSEGEVAFEHDEFGHGVFFHFVIEGLKGDADLDKDATVSLPELEAFTKKRVSDYVRSKFDAARQMPQVINNSRGLMTVVTVTATPQPPVAEEKPLETRIVASTGTVLEASGTWSDPMPIGRNIDTEAAGESTIALSPDGLSAFFVRSIPNEKQAIWRSVRPASSAAFGPPVKIDQLDAAGDGAGTPTLAADGLEIFFDARNGQDWNIWTSRRRDLQSPFSAPERIRGPINTSAAEGKPSITGDGLTLFFHADRPHENNRFSIWMTRRSAINQDFGAPVPLGPNVNAGGRNMDPAISADGRLLIFASDRAGGVGGLDLWMSSRSTPEIAFGPATNLGPKINTSGQEGKPSLSPDGQTLYFTSQRGSQGEVWVSQRQAGAATSASSIDGTWSFLSGELNGQSMTAALSQDRSLEIDGTSYILRIGPTRIEGTVRIDATTTPGQIEFTKLRGGADELTGVRQPGIFRIDGDELTIVVSGKPGTPRPTAFASAGEGVSLQKYRRANFNTVTRSRTETPPVPQADEPWVVFLGKDGPGVGKHIVLVSGDEEYRSEEALPQLAKILSTRHGFRCTVLFAIDKQNGTINPAEMGNIPGLDALRTADLMVIATRMRSLPDDQMQHIVDYVESGRPVLGLRTATHAFKLPATSRFRRYSWDSKEWPGGFGRQVLGETWVGHHGNHGKESTRGIIVLKQAKHPILRGIKNGDVWGPSDTYAVASSLEGDSQPLLSAQVVGGLTFDSPAVRGAKNNPMMPLAWTKSYTAASGTKARVFTTTLGAAVDFAAEGSRRLIVNAVYWCLAMEDKIRAKSDVDIVGEYNPSPFGIGTFRKGVMPAALSGSTLPSNMTSSGSVDK